MTDQRWRLEANCLGVDPDEFFPDGSGNHVHPMVWATCRACVCIQQCLDYALDRNLSEGVFGGTTPMERRRLTVGDKPPILSRCCRTCGAPAPVPGSQFCGACADEWKAASGTSDRKRNQRSVSAA